MLIRRLEAADLRPYRAMMLHAYAAVPDAYTSTADERASLPDAWWVARMGSPEGQNQSWGAFDGAQLMGTVALEFSGRAKTRHKALLVGMFVAEAARGRGAGRALVEAALDAASAREGMRAVTLTVTEGNEAAIALYRSCGFVPWGTEPLAIATAGALLGKVHMVCDLAARSRGPDGLSTKG